MSNAEWFERAQRVIPGGVDSPVRSFRSVGGTPYTVVSGKGAYVTDIEGTTYIDYVQSYGASLLGHAHDDVVAAIKRQAELGTTFGAPTPGEVQLAELMVDRVPGLEQARLVSSGTEAVMSAVRLARLARAHSHAPVRVAGLLLRRAAPDVHAAPPRRLRDVELGVEPHAVVICTAESKRGRWQ